jgi:predicted DNA-binding protein (MmcQ/YjbR family)
MHSDKTSASAATKRAEANVRELALAYPETREDFPWGHSAFKVKEKVFLFMGIDGDGLGVSVKLPQSHVRALDLPNTQPTPYGLGKSGWVSASFGSKGEVPMDLLRAWLDESYRAIAPKKCIAMLDGAAEKPVKTSSTSKSPSARAKPAAKPRAKVTARKAKKKA